MARKLNVNDRFAIRRAVAAGCLCASVACMAAPSSFASPTSASDSAISAELPKAGLAGANTQQTPLVDDDAVQERFQAALGQLSLTGQIILRQG